MKTVALRFGEQFAPECGTMAAHQKVISEKEFVWYGKLGNPVSIAVAKEILSQDSPAILLISSGKQERYWAYINAIQRETPDIEWIPEYYRDKASQFKTWFRVTRFEPAPKDVMSEWVVASSGKPLNEVSRHSMSPYFIIEPRRKKN